MAGSYVPPLPEPPSAQEIYNKSLTDNLPSIDSSSSNAPLTNFDYFYHIDPNSWYKVFPFAFQIDNEDDVVCRFFLPIPPQNYTIQDMSTSEAHATIGGVVEEINAPVFSMITLVGTTGLSLNNPELGKNDGDELPSLAPRQRKILDDLLGTKNPITKLIKGAVDGAISLVETEQSLPYQDAPSAVNTPVSNPIQKAFSGDTPASASSFLDKINPFSSSTPDVPKNEFSNGWAWSQALRQFFLIYQRERANNPNLVLYFSDYKSRASYRCIPRSIQFQQNANSPYLINYTIILKCWALEDANNEDLGIKAVDRFNSDLKEVNTTNITSVISKVGKVCNTLNRFPSVAGSFVRNSTGSFL